MKYDVFISYSRKDYVDAMGKVLPDSPVKAILNLLEEHDIHYWFDKNGIYSGTEFAETIVEAINESRMLVFISSQYSNESENTAGEIKEAKDKDIPILIVKIDDTDFSKKFRYYINTIDFIDYNKIDALPRLLDSINKTKAEVVKKEKQRQAIADEKKRQIKGYVNRLEELKCQKSSFLKEIYQRLQELTIKSKQCPVCGTRHKLDVSYCDKCGWYFPALSSIKVDDKELVASVDKDVLIFARERWEAKSIAPKTATNRHSLSRTKAVAGIIASILLFFGFSYMFSYSERVKIEKLSADLQSQLELSRYMNDTLNMLMRDNFAQKEIIEQKERFIETYLKEVTFNIPYQVGTATIILDAKSEAELRKMINDIKSYDGELVALEIENCTSPEGNLSYNKDLATARAKSFSELIKPHLGDIEPTITYKLHTWLDVADILYEKGYTAEADSIYANKDKPQEIIYAEIRRNAELYELARTVLPQLRYTTCKFKMVHSSYTKPDR